MTPADFIKAFGGNAVIGSLVTNKLFPSVVLAQTALETGWGKSVPANNLFGIKADTSWNGKVTSQSTTEYVGGVKHYYTGSGKTYSNRQAAIAAGEPAVTLFRAYPSTIDSFIDRNKFLIENPRYTAHGVFTATTPEEQAQALEAAGYATAPNYASTIISIINANNLKEFDKKKTQCETLLSS